MADEFLSLGRHISLMDHILVRLSVASCNPRSSFELILQLRVPLLRLAIPGPTLRQLITIENFSPFDSSLLTALTAIHGFLAEGGEY